jgi:hypothetical protein
MKESVSVQFKQYFPVFPLPETTLLPHSAMPLSVFDSSFKQLTDHSLDGSGQIAFATFSNPGESSGPGDVTPLRDVVCLAQIIEHEKVENGYNMMVYGLCRAKIIEEIKPEGECLYRKAKLVPVEKKEEELDEIYRVELLHMLFRPNLSRLDNHETMMDWIVGSELSNTALFEVISSSVFEDSELRYELLSEPSCEKRSKRILSELSKLDRMLEMAEKQPKDILDGGLSKN